MVTPVGSDWALERRRPERKEGDLHEVISLERLSEGRLEVSPRRTRCRSAEAGWGAGGGGWPCGKGGAGGEGEGESGKWPKRTSSEDLGAA